jgi:hypothetical protein
MQLMRVGHELDIRQIVHLVMETSYSNTSPVNAHQRHQFAENWQTKRRRYVAIQKTRVGHGQRIHMIALMVQTQLPREKRLRNARRMHPFVGNTEQLRNVAMQVIRVGREHTIWISAWIIK